MPEPSDLLPGLGDALKAHLRDSDEPRDVAFFMVLVMNLSIWAFLTLMPFGAVLFLIHNGALPYAIIEDGWFTVAITLGCVVLICAVAQYLGYRKGRELRALRANVQEIIDAPGDKLIIIVSGKDAEKQWPEIQRRLDAWERAGHYAEESESENVQR